MDVVHDLPGVGRNLQDHIDVYTINELSGRHSYDHYRQFGRQLWAGAQWKLLGSGPATSNLAEGGAFWWADREQGVAGHPVPTSCPERGSSRGCRRSPAPDAP